MFNLRSKIDCRTKRKQKQTSHSFKMQTDAAELMGQKQMILILFDPVTLTYDMLN